MKENSLVSVVITTHNRLELLKNAVGSVIAQTYKNIEIIVVDDASNDGTYEFYQGNKNVIRYIRIEPHCSKGGNYARNVGIQNANGKYIAFLDDDDEWLPNKISEQIELIDEGKNIQFVGCGIYKIGKKKFKLKEKKSVLLDGDLKEIVLYSIPYKTSTIFATKKIIDQINGFDENLDSWQEYEMEIRLFQITKAATVRKNLVIYRVGNSEHKNVSGKFDGWLESINYINNKHKELFANASKEVLKKKEILFLSEAARKAEVSNNSCMKKYYLKRLYEAQPNFKNLIRKKICFYSYMRLIGFF